jgi:hypothetical protein
VQIHFSIERRTKARSVQCLLFMAMLWCFIACHAETVKKGSENGSPSEDGKASVGAARIVISATKRRPRPANWSVQYWSWLSGDQTPVEGTQALIRAVRPALMRIGGYNSDANRPEPFTNEELDKAIAYARAIDAQPLLQVPLIGNVNGHRPTSMEAAEIVKYVNVSHDYAVKYFAIGNEPDLYATQGSLADPSQPAFPDYTPEDYCATVVQFSNAMKAVDPTIKIVGPQLSYKYQASDDWLSPILRTCGEHFDIVSIQRFPFTAAQASVANAARDASAFRRLIRAVRDLMAAAGYGDKPLAITGMNLAYDSARAGSEPGDAAPGTVGAALWLADITGAALELDLWTTVLWSISDADTWSLGLIGPPPMHAPRPAYYAYQLYADHMGPTLLEVSDLPSGVSAYASRNQSDDGTQVITMNWNSSSVAIGVEVTGLSKPPAVPIFELSSLSMTSIEIPDSGSVMAWSYGREQQTAGMGPQILLPSTGAGKSEISSWPVLPVPACAARTLAHPSITVSGKAGGTGPSFGSGTDAWGSFSFAGSGQPLPRLTVTPEGTGFELSGELVEPLTNNYEGAGLYFNDPYCADVSAYAGVSFEVKGELGGCNLAFGASSADHVSPMHDPSRGHCSVDHCYGPRVDITDQVGGVDSGVGASGASQGDHQSESVTVRVPFSSLRGGSPSGTLDPTTLENIQWQLSAQAHACHAELIISNVTFY